MSRPSGSRSAIGKPTRGRSGNSLAPGHQLRAAEQKPHGGDILIVHAHPQVHALGSAVRAASDLTNLTASDDR